MKDWSGNTNSVFKIISASNHTEEEREENDFYATDPVAIDKLYRTDELTCKNIWECACGEGHLAKKLVEYGYNVKATDLIDRGYGEGGVDFLACKDKFNGDILTNPPYKFSPEFTLKALDLIPDGNKVFMFLKLTFLEGKKRYDELFSKYPPKKIYVFSQRVLCAKNGDFNKTKANGGSAVAYAWYVWEKGYTGDTVVKWI